MHAAPVRRFRIRRTCVIFDFISVKQLNFLMQFNWVNARSVGGAAERETRRKIATDFHSRCSRAENTQNEWKIITEEREKISLALTLRCNAFQLCTKPVHWDGTLFSGCIVRLNQKESRQSLWRFTRRQPAWIRFELIVGSILCKPKRRGRGRIASWFYCSWRQSSRAVAPSEIKFKAQALQTAEIMSDGDA